MTLHDLRAGALLVIEKLLWEDCMFKALDSCLREYSIPEKKTSSPPHAKQAFVAENWPK